MIELLFIGALAFSESSSKIDLIISQRITEQMKLTAAEEKAFLEDLGRFAQSRREINQKVDDRLGALSSQIKLDPTISDKKKLENRYREFRSAMIESNRVSENELKHIEKKFGTIKAAKYAVARREVFQKLEDVLSASESAASKSPVEGKSGSN